MATRACDRAVDSRDFSLHLGVCLWHGESQPHFGASFDASILVARAYRHLCSDMDFDDGGRSLNQDARQPSSIRLPKTDARGNPHCLSDSIFHRLFPASFPIGKQRHCDTCVTSGRWKVGNDLFCSFNLYRLGHQSMASTSKESVCVMILAAHSCESARLLCGTTKRNSSQNREPITDAAHPKTWTD